MIGSFRKDIDRGDRYYHLGCGRIYLYKIKILFLKDILPKDGDITHILMLNFLMSLSNHKIL